MTYRLAITAFALLTLIGIALMLRVPSWWMIPAALAGWWAADLASGVTHMLMDYSPCRPGLGQHELFFYPGARDSAEYHSLKREVFGRLSPFERIVFDFKTHHPRPDALGRRGFVAQVGSTVLFTTLPAALLLDLAAWAWGLPGWVLALAWTLLIGASLAQYFHGALHRPDTPPAIRAMRATRLLCTPIYHQRHHNTLQCDFATISGWSNPLLNRVFTGLRRRGMLDDAGLEPG